MASKLFDLARQTTTTVAHHLKTYMRLGPSRRHLPQTNHQSRVVGLAVLSNRGVSTRTQGDGRIKFNGYSSVAFRKDAMKRVKRQFVLPRKKTLRIPGSAIEPSTGRALVQPSTLNSKAKRRSKERETTDEQTKDNTKTPHHAPKPKTKGQEISDMTIGLNSIRSGSSRKMNILGPVAKDRITAIHNTLFRNPEPTRRDKFDLLSNSNDGNKTSNFLNSCPSLCNVNAHTNIIDTSEIKTISDNSSQADKMIQNSVHGRSRKDKFEFGRVVRENLNFCNWSLALDKHLEQVNSKMRKTPLVDLSNRGIPNAGGDGCSLDVKKDLYISVPSCLESDLLLPSSSSKKIDENEIVEANSYQGIRESENDIKQYSKTGNSFILIESEPQTQTTVHNGESTTPVDLSDASSSFSRPVTLNRKTLPTPEGEMDLPVGNIIKEIQQSVLQRVPGVRKYRDEQKIVNSSGTPSEINVVSSSGSMLPISQNDLIFPSSDFFKQPNGKYSVSKVDVAELKPNLGSSKPAIKVNVGNETKSNKEDREPKLKISQHEISNRKRKALPDAIGYQSKENISSSVSASRHSSITVGAGDIPDVSDHKLWSQILINKMNEVKGCTKNGPSLLCAGGDKNYVPAFPGLDCVDLDTEVTAKQSAVLKEVKMVDIFGEREREGRDQIDSKGLNLLMLPRDERVKIESTHKKATSNVTAERKKSHIPKIVSLDSINSKKQTKSEKKKVKEKRKKEFIQPQKTKFKEHTNALNYILEAEEKENHNVNSPVLKLCSSPTDDQPSANSPGISKLKPSFHKNNVHTFFGSDFKNDHYSTSSGPSTDSGYHLGSDGCNVGQPYRENIKQEDMMENNSSFSSRHPQFGKIKREWPFLLSLGGEAEMEMTSSSQNEQSSRSKEVPVKRDRYSARRSERVEKTSSPLCRQDCNPTVENVMFGARQMDDVRDMLQELKAKLQQQRQGEDAMVYSDTILAYKKKILRHKKELVKCKKILQKIEENVRFSLGDIGAKKRRNQGSPTMPTCNIAF